METIDDIVYEVRGNAEHNHALIEVSKYLTEIADRIEKAENHGYHALQVHLKKLEAECENELAEKSRIIAELNEVRELNRKCCDENERIKQFDQEKDRLIEKLKSHLSTAINALAPKCVDCADVCDTCDCRHSAWIPFAKLLIAGLDYDESDYESLPLVSMTVNRTEIENLKDENARLRAAIQHVLDIVMDEQTSDLSMELAINEAKRIYNESMKGKNNE